MRKGKIFLSIRTDLAAERLAAIKNRPICGASQKEETLHDIRLITVTVSDHEAAAALEKPMGRYLTLICAPFRKAPEHFEEEVLALSEALSRLLPEGAVLVAGLGNASITPDALGPAAARQILATRHVGEETAAALGIRSFRPVSVLAPGVLGQTGMETCEILAALVRETKPAALIAIDALAAGDPERVGTTVQICDSGISPGSGVSNRRKELSRRTLGIPVIAIGVPTVVDYPRGDDPEPMMVTPREIDTVIENAARTIAMAVNCALQPELSLEDLMALTQ